jgi:RNA polymerase sigma-70 factor (ECF subfamily)
MILELLVIEPPPPGGDSPDLRRRFGARDRDVWDRLVRDEHGRIFNLHLRLIGDREAAADLTQDTFAEAWRSAEGYSGDGAPRAWLYGVAANVNRNWLRRQGRHEPPDEADDTLPDPEPTAEEIALLRERTDVVLSAVRELPESYRRTVAMRYFGGLTGPEIAQIEGVEPGTIRWRIHEANKLLWAALAPTIGEEGDDGAGQDGELRIAP